MASAISTGDIIPVAPSTVVVPTAVVVLTFGALTVYFLGAFFFGGILIQLKE